MKLGKIFCCPGRSCSDTSGQVGVQTSQNLQGVDTKKDRSDRCSTTPPLVTRPTVRRFNTPPRPLRSLTPELQRTTQPTMLTNKGEILNMISDDTKTLDEFWLDVSEDLKQDQGFIHKILEKLSSKDQAAKLELFWTECISAELKNNIDFMLQAIRFHSYSLKYVGSKLKMSKTFVLKVMENNGLALEHAEPEFKKDLDVVIAAIQQNSNALGYADAQLKENPKIILAAVKIILDAVETKIDASLFDNSVYTKNRQFFLSAVKINGLALKYAASELRSDKNIVLTAVQQNGYALSHAASELQADKDIVLAAVQQNGLALKHAAIFDNSVYTQNRQFFLSAVKINGLVLKYAASELQADKDIVLAAVQQNGYALSHAASELQADKDIVLVAVQQNGLALKHAASALQADTNIVLAAVKQNSFVFLYLPSTLKRDKEFTLAAVSQNGLALRLVDPKFKKDVDVVLAAIQQNSNALCFIDSQLTENPKIISAAVKIILDALETKIDALLFDNSVYTKNRQFFLSAVKINGLALKYAASELRSDKNIVLAAVQQNGYALSHAASELQADKDIVLAAVQQNGLALKYAVLKLRSDKEIGLAAVKQNLFVFLYLPSTLKRDKEFTLAAVSQNGLALRLVDPKFKKDVDVVLAAIQQNSNLLRFALEYIDNVIFKADILRNRPEYFRVFEKQDKTNIKKLEDIIGEVIDYDPSLFEVLSKPLQTEVIKTAAKVAKQKKLSLHGYQSTADFRENMFYFMQQNISLLRPNIKCSYERDKFLKMFCFHLNGPVGYVSFREEVGQDYGGVCRDAMRVAVQCLIEIKKEIDTENEALFLPAEEGVAADAAPAPVFSEEGVVAAPAAAAAAPASNQVSAEMAIRIEEEQAIKKQALNQKQDQFDFQLGRLLRLPVLYDQYDRLDGVPPTPIIFPSINQLLDPVTCIAAFCTVFDKTGRHCVDYDKLVGVLLNYEQLKPGYMDELIKRDESLKCILEKYYGFKYFLQTHKEPLDHSNPLFYAEHTLCTQLKRLPASLKARYKEGELHPELQIPLLTLLDPEISNEQLKALLLVSTQFELDKTDQSRPSSEHVRLAKIREGMGDVCFASGIVDQVIDVSFSINAEDLKGVIKGPEYQKKLLLEYIDSIRDNQEQLSDLLIFITGSSSIPKQLRVKHVPDETHQLLPVAHTCSMEIEFPNYSDQTVFNKKFTQAICHWKHDQTMHLA